MGTESELCFYCEMPIQLDESSVSVYGAGNRRAHTKCYNEEYGEDVEWDSLDDEEEYD